MGDVVAHPKYVYKFRPTGSEPFDPENYINNVPSYSYSTEPTYFDPDNPEKYVGSAPSYSYSNESTRFEYIAPGIYIGSVPTYSYSREPFYFDPINPEKYLDLVPYDCWIDWDGEVEADDSDLASEHVGDWMEGNDEADKPTDTYGNTVSDGWGSSKGKSAIDESSGTAANKWNRKESFSASKAAAWNTPGEKETGARCGAWGNNPDVELSGETGDFARKCSLGADNAEGMEDMVVEILEGHFAQECLSSNS